MCNEIKSRVSVGCHLPPSVNKLSRAHRAMALLLPTFTVMLANITEASSLEVDETARGAYTRQVVRSTVPGGPATLGHFGDDLWYMEKSAGVPLSPDFEGDFLSRSYFDFDLSSVRSQIRSAELIVRDVRTLTANPVTATFYDVTTPSTELRLNDDARPDIYEDLGSGTVYGSHVLSGSPPTTYTVALNESAVSAINSSRGSSVAVGGGITSDGDDQFLGIPKSTMIGGTLKLQLGTTHVLAAGVNWDDINGGAAAASVGRAFKSVLDEPAGDRVRVLPLESSSATNVQTLSDAIASTPVEPGDTFVFYVTSHGLGWPNSRSVEPGDEAEVDVATNLFYGVPTARGPSTQDEQLLLGDPNDPRRWMSDDELGDIFRADPSKWNEVHKLFILDSCFSGGFWGGSDGTDLDKLPGGKTALIAASDEANFALAAYGTGYMTRSLVRALEGISAAGVDLSFDELVSVLGATYSGNVTGTPLDMRDYWGVSTSADLELFVRTTDDFDMGTTRGVPEPSGAILAVAIAYLAAVGRRQKR